MRKLIHEIHRRSLWQVLGIYIALSWVVLQVVDVLGDNIGLPEWVGPTAFALLLVGLPIVVGTAFIQEGMTTKEAEAPRQSLADAGEIPPPPAPELEARHRLFTWRNALIGGAAAFALLGLLTAGYLFMRASGIGPAGTLVAQGVLEDGAQVVLADFASADPELADVVTGALRIDLVQSPTIRIVSSSTLQSALRRMQLDDEAPITADVAREIAVREGYRAVIEGEIGSAGSGYVLTASILAGEGWEPQAAFRATAKNEDALIDAIEELSRDIRDKAGESLRSVRAAPALDQVTTSSLEALRLYTRGEDLENSDPPGAVELYERAAEIDPDFAMAYRKIGVNLGNMGTRRQDEVAALRRAFDLRDRLPPAERHLVEAYYHQGVSGDREAASRAYERLLEIAPEDIAALNNLALIHADLGRFEDGERLLERAVEVEPFAVAYANLARARSSLGLMEDAEEAVEEWVARLPESSVFIEEVRINLRLADGRSDETEALLAAYEERHPTGPARERRAHLEGVLLGARGQLRQADDELADASGGSYFFAHPMRVARERASLALVRGDSASAVALLLDANEALGDATPAADRVFGWWLPTLVEAGAVGEAERLFEEWRAAVPDDELGWFDSDGRRELEARLAAGRGRLDEAVRLWQAYERECPGACVLVSSFALAQIHERRGEVGDAIAEYERYLADTFHRRWWYDAYRKGPALERLALLYDEAGDGESARRYYDEFVALWADADAELQPRVAAARARLAELTEAAG